MCKVKGISYNRIIRINILLHAMILAIILCDINGCKSSKENKEPQPVPQEDYAGQIKDQMNPRVLEASKFVIRNREFRRALIMNRTGQVTYIQQLKETYNLSSLEVAAACLIASRIELEDSSEEAKETGNSGVIIQPSKTFWDVLRSIQDIEKAGKLADKIMESEEIKAERKAKKSIYSPSVSGEMKNPQDLSSDEQAALEEFLKRIYRKSEDKGTFIREKFPFFITEIFVHPKSGMRLEHPIKTLGAAMIFVDSDSRSRLKMQLRNSLEHQIITWQYLGKTKQLAIIDYEINIRSGSVVGGDSMDISDSVVIVPFKLHVEEK